MSPGHRCLLAVSSWFLVLSCSSAQSVNPTAQQLTLQGRFSPGLNTSVSSSLPQTFSWPASSVYTSFEGTTSVSVSISAIPPITNVTYGINWFRFFIDGQPAADGFTSYNQLLLIVTLNVTSSYHTLRIAKMNDGAKGEAVLQSISLSSGGRFLTSPGIPSQTDNRRILILGDSYAVGYGNAGAVIPKTCLPSSTELTAGMRTACQAIKVQDAEECADIWKILNQNSLEAFGPVAAESLGADYQVLAASGTGMVGYSLVADVHPGLSLDEYEAILPSNAAMFNRTVHSAATPQYPLQSWSPQVVLVTSGTNDWHSFPPIYTLSEWLQNATDFLQQISVALDQPTIIIQAWPPEQQLAGAVDGYDEYNETIQYFQAMPSLFTEAVKRRVPNLYYLQLDTRNYDNLYSWCDHHPSAAADRAVAAQVVSFIEATVPGWNATRPVNFTVDQQAIRPSTALYSSGSAVAPLAASSSAG